ncbi:hypothetical protein [Leeuwenhoekiella sp. H156]|uniref:hypothetical protein n=1 Tax=Leeuwenhoekiella sp. H156 TaxID=3450128 RepID=UPI003FA41F36
MVTKVKSVLVLGLFFLSPLAIGQTNTLPTTGKVGVGTVSPQGTALNVIGNGTIGPTDNLNYSWLLVGEVQQGIGMDDNQITQVGDQLYLAAKTGSIRYKTMGFDRGVVTNSGNFGFGTITPLGRVEIRNTGTIAGEWQPGRSFLHINDGTNALIMDPNEFYTSTTLNIGSSSSDIVVFRALEAPIARDLMTIKRDGSVGIGTKTTGDHLLAVEGSVGAREVKVEMSSWPDFVFDKEYKLMPLKDLNFFLKSNRHLPEIPNKEHILKNGISLGDMNAMLLQKIEELTLYIINQNEKIENLELQNKNINNRLSVLSHQSTRE